MAKDIQGLGLGLASRFAASPLAQKYGLAKPAEKIAYISTKIGFQLVQKALAKKQQKKLLNTKALPAPAALFDLSLSEEQQMIRDSIQSYAKDNIRPAALSADEAAKLPDSLLADAQELGLNYFAIPENLGGAGQLSPMTNVLVAEDLAWGDFSLAFALLASSSVVNTLSRWGNKQQQEQWLPKFFSEEKTYNAAIAVQEPQPLFDSNLLRCKAKKNKKGYVISGIKSLVPLGGSSQLYLVAAQYKGQNQVFIVPADSKGLSFTSSPAMGLRSAEVGTLKLDKVQLDQNALLAEGAPQHKSFDYQTFIDSSQLSWCAMAIGCCQAALDYLIPYVNERYAFGEPISHRQSVAFMLSDMKIEIESMRLLVWKAASRFERGEEFHRDAFLAHQLCIDKSMEIGTNAVQLLGGHGFTKEHPAERWYRDLRVLAIINGGLQL
ncbi:MAG: acyl-CoA dehydrogenase family protein [Oleispira sp.]|nr:acyl-CoA dehydrogenase family protein [Oleispira sp.]